MDVKETRRDFLLRAMQKGFTQVLDEAKVPQREHLAIIKVLAERISAHKKDIGTYQADLLRHQSVDAEHAKHMTAHLRQIAEWDSKVRAVVSKDWTGAEGKKGDKGEPGNDAPLVNEDAIVGRIMSSITLPKDGKDGADAESLDEEVLMSRLLEKIKTEKLLDMSHIRGAQSFIKDGVRYRFEELMHGGGSKAGGSGLVYLPLISGTIDNTNKVFTFASTPTIVVANGASYINGFGVTISGTTATMDNPVGTGGSLYALG